MSEKSRENTKGKALNFSLQILLISFIILGKASNNACAHYIQTHQTMIRFAKNALINVSPYTNIHNFLDSTVIDRGVEKTYLRLLKEGVRDADLRANGLYAISKITYNTCYDLTYEGECRMTESTYDMTDPPWPVGDHGYNPETGRGYNSLIENYNDFVADKKDKYPEEYNQLLAQIDERYPDCVPKPDCLENKLIEILQTSNAADMAQEFYERAQHAWKENRFIDSMFNLGVALHLVQDLTVPYHADLLLDLPPPEIPCPKKSAHDCYEEYIWLTELEEGNKIYTIKLTGDYSDFNAMTWVKRNAEKSYEFDPHPTISAEDSVRLGVSSTIGLIVSFFHSVGYIPPFTVELDFNSLPTQQGWSFAHHLESDKSSVDGEKLTINTIGWGEESAYYSMHDIVEPLLPFTLSVRARLQPNSIDSNQVSFSVRYGPEAWTFGLAENRVFTISAGGPIFPINTFEFHDYVIEGKSKDYLKFYIDGVLKESTIPWNTNSNVRSIHFGDGNGTAGINTFAEISEYKFTQGNPNCNNIYPEDPIYPGYGSPYNVLFDANEFLVNVLCNSSSVTVEIGSGKNNQYIYRLGYIYNFEAETWELYDLTGDDLQYDNWYVGNATGYIVLSPSELIFPQYLVAFVCTWTGTEWKCGCRDKVCSESYWQLQIFGFESEAKSDIAGDLSILAMEDIPPPPPTPLPSQSIAEIIGTWSNGIRYWDVAASEWTKMTASAPTGDITAGDFTGDGKADVASCWDSGLWYQDGDTLDWTKVSGPGAVYLTAGDVTGDGRSEIIGTWSSGIWYWDVAESEWTKMTSSSPTGDVTAGDFTGDGKSDVASIWGSGLWFQDGDSLAWTKVTGSAPVSLTAGDVTGDGRFEIIGTWSSGIWYWDLVASKWTQMTSSTPTGDIAAGDFTGDGKSDVASIWASGLWFQDGATLDWTKVSDSAPVSLTAGDVTGN